jgi:hypothetical protein
MAAVERRILLRLMQERAISAGGSSPEAPALAAWLTGRADEAPTLGPWL